jgi:hypothetical protein
MEVAIRGRSPKTMHRPTAEIDIVPNQVPALGLV